jgi:hypothetical protein
MRAYLKYIIIGTIMLTSVVPLRAADYTVLEALIASHKKQSNKLKERCTGDVAMLAMSTSEEEEMTKYEKVVKQLGNRVGDVMSYVAFAGEMATIVSISKDVIELEKDVVGMAAENAIKYPQVALEVLEIEKEFGSTTKEIVDMTVYIAAAGAGVSLATQAQRKQFTSIMYNKLSNLKYKMRNALFKCRCLTYMKPNALKYGKGAWGLIEAIIPEKKQEALINSVKSSFKKNQRF